MISSVAGESSSDRSPLDLRSLRSQTAALRLRFQSAEPWPHLIIDDFLDREFAEGAIAAFPPVGRAKTWLARLLGARSYRASASEENAWASRVFDVLHSPHFTNFLEQVSGIEGLEPDRELIGAGFHQGVRGSYLRVHSDHNTHPFDASRYRRISVLVYLNDQWDAAWNGDLELWDRNALSCRKKIEPMFNRCIIMQVDDTAFHGYGRLNLPAGISRRALAVYYYSNVPGAGQSASPHYSAFPELSGESRFGSVVERMRRSALYRIEKVFRIPKY